MNSQEIKNYIRQWKSQAIAIVSPIGEIKLGEQLGEGGTAIVFASDFAGGSAVKFLAESVQKKSNQYKRFLNEYVNFLRLTSTGMMVPLYFFGIQNVGDELLVPYIVMERCSNTLKDQYKDNKLGNIDDFEKLVERLLKVLEILHNAKIFHRDIKPENILLRSNGDWVLADFGIAWFDPKTYEQLAKTENSDKLANFDFSPPEQRRRDSYDKPVPNMDLFALGQTLYYCVTGHTIRGTKYSRFSEIAPSLAKYDPLIERLVRQNPSDRFQSVEEIRKFLEEQDSNDKEFNEYEKIIEPIKKFDECLRQAIPRARGYKQAEDSTQINRVLNLLAENVQSCSLYWMRGEQADHPINQMQLIEEFLLINQYEWKLVDLWIYRNTTALDRQCVIIHLGTLPPFEINGKKSMEAGYFQGKYIDYNECEDGYREIDGKIVELNDTEYRCRKTEDEFLILSPKFSVYREYSEFNREILKSFYQRLCNAGKIDESTLKLLKALEQAEWMTQFR